MAKKLQFTDAELKNDPSLRWCPYRRSELVYSDVHQAPVRFLEYANDRVLLASLNGIAPLPVTAGRLQVRRPSVMTEQHQLPTEIRQGIVAEQKSKRAKT